MTVTNMVIALLITSINTNTTVGAGNEFSVTRTVSKTKRLEVYSPGSWKGISVKRARMREEIENIHGDLESLPRFLAISVHEIGKYGPCNFSRIGWIDMEALKKALAEGGAQ